MNTRILLAAMTLLAGAATASATVASRTMKSVEMVDPSGKKLRCSVGQEGNRLFVLTPMGIEVFEQSGPANIVDFAAPSVRVLRNGDVVTVLHSAGIATFRKVVDDRRTHTFAPTE